MLNPSSESATRALLHSAFRSTLIATPHSQSFKNPTPTSVAMVVLSRILFGPETNGARICAQRLIPPEYPLDATFHLVRQFDLCRSRPGSIAHWALAN